MERWQVLTVGGLLGLASLWFVRFEILVPVVEFTMKLRHVSLIQPGIITLMAVLVGQFLAPKVGLRAPLLDAALTEGSVTSALWHCPPSAFNSQIGRIK